MATYREIQAYVREQHGFVPQTCWIAHVKELSGAAMRQAPNRLGSQRVKPCPPAKLEVIEATLRKFGMI